ncbi:MAG: FAD-dependent oxidoreductase [Gemmatimonadetes bacterium]|nr:FAD-dependent oxidoreductase [Gemmatimonadota bacterium]
MGHAGGAPVIVVRRGDEVFAVGATCTHYGGPLAEGLVVGETIRCPWHHACFSLRTGAVLEWPAPNPLPCWEVEVRDGVVRVGRKRERDPLEPERRPGAPAVVGARAGGEPATVVIVGAGAAGNAAAEGLRREGYGGRVLLVDPDADAPYDRPNLSKDYLAGNAPEEWIPLRPEGFHAEHGIERMVAAVSGIDAARRRVMLSDGRELEYGALLLATGAAPIRLPLPGAELPHVYVLRSLADSRAIIRAAERGGRAVVLGASFIGLEVAASLRARGLEVTVVAPEAVPLARVMGEALGRFVRGLHEEHGVAFRLGRKPTEVRADAVVLDDGSAVPADLVVMGVGVRPVVELAEAAGLEVDRGVVVDERLRTSVPGIWAAGDIARYPDPISGERVRIEHWVVAERQGAYAARSILGTAEPFRAVPFFWSQHYDVPIAYVGHAESWDELVVDGDPAARDVAVAFRKGGRTLALATIYRDRASLEEEAALEEELRHV